MPVKKLVILGDSITDCGRARPVGEGLPGALTPWRRWITPRGNCAS